MCVCACMCVRVRLHGGDYWVVWYHWQSASWHSITKKTVTWSSFISGHHRVWVIVGVSFQRPASVTADTRNLASFKHLSLPHIHTDTQPHASISHMAPAPQSVNHLCAHVTSRHPGSKTGCVVGRMSMLHATSRSHLLHQGKGTQSGNMGAEPNRTQNPLHQSRERSCSPCVTR